MTVIAFNLIALLSMYLLLGLTGIFSMGQAAFMSVGAYTAAMLATRTPIPMPIVLIIAVVIGMAISCLVGLPVIKLRRDYIALITLGFGEALVALLNHATNITGGAIGIPRIPRLMSLPLAILILAIVIYLVINFKYSKFGRHCIAIKNDEISAAAMGINVARVKLLVFTFAGGLTALAGAMFAYTTTFVEPMAFGVWRTIDWISIVFVGGVNSLTGSLFSGILFNILPEALRAIDMYRIIIQCIVVLLIVNFLPRGIMGEFEIWHLPKWIRDKRKQWKNRQKAKESSK